MPVTDAGEFFRIEAIEFAFARAARETMAHDKGLTEDEWDASSLHYGLYAGAQLVGAYRVVAPRYGRLPVSEHCCDLAVAPQDRQIGRLVATRPLMTHKARAAFFTLYLLHLREAAGRVYVASAEKGPICARRWERLGFMRTGAAYQDPRYGDPLQIFVRTSG